MEDMLVKIFQSFGFTALTCAALMYVLLLVLKWFAQFIDKNVKASEEREQRYCLIIAAQTTAMNSHTEQAREFHNEVKMAHEFQRTEHERLTTMMDGVQQAIGRINGHKAEN